jgi:TRAP-type uncharacterized transport system substrate-binding protein
MPKTLRFTLLSLRDLLVSAGPFALLSIGLLAAAYWWLDPNPPKRVVLATGPAQSAYEEFGKRYAKQLAASGIEVLLLPSEGSSANLQLLREGKADLGFVQGGSHDAAADDASGLQSLGSLFVEPVWMFYREAALARVTRPATAGTRAPAAPARLSSLTGLQGLRVNVGTPGSGVPSLMGKLLEANRVDTRSLTLSQLEQTPATVAFLNGDLDVLVFASAPEALMVQMLLQTPGVRLLDFAQSEAYSRRFAFLTPVTLPRGVVDLAGNVPPEDVRLVASTTALLTRETTHPALLQLFSQAAMALHGGAGWFNRAGEFPTARLSELPLSREAERTFRNGPPLLQRYLPFWLANLVERMWLALGIIIAVLLPASRIVPPLYEFRIRSRVFRWYGKLREIESRIADLTGPPQPLIDELNELEARVGQISVPLSYTDELYALRNHIHLVRRQLVKA